MKIHYTRGYCPLPFVDRLKLLVGYRLDLHFNPADGTLTHAVNARRPEVVLSTAIPVAAPVPLTLALATARWNTEGGFMYSTGSAIVVGPELPLDCAPTAIYYDRNGRYSQAEAERDLVNLKLQHYIPLLTPV